MNRKLRIIALFLPIYTILPRQAPAINRSWDDGGGTANWSEAANWRPNNTPQANDDIFIGDRPEAVNDTTIYNVNGPPLGSLTITNGADVDTDGNQLRVEGPTVVDTLSVPGASVIVRPALAGPTAHAFDTDTLTIGNGANLNLQGGIVSVDGGLLSIEQGGDLTGYGLIELDFNSGGAPVFDNGGRIIVHGDSANDDATLTIRANGNGTIDSSSGTIDVDNGAAIGALTLALDGPHEGQFNDTIDIGRDDTVNIVQPWAFAGAEINFNGSSGVATLTGAPLTDSLANHSHLNVNSGTAVIENDLLNVFLATVADNSTLQLDGTAEINLDFGHLNVALVVGGDTTISRPFFDWDGLSSSSTTTVGPGAVLDINAMRLEEGGGNVRTFDAVIHMNSGDVNVGIISSLEVPWVMNGVLNMARTTGLEVPELSGSPVEIGNGDGAIAEINVSGGFVSRISADATFRSDAEVNVAAGTVFQLGGITLFESGSATTLNGDLHLGSLDVQILSGASFAGSGRVVNTFNANLTLHLGANIGVLLDNVGNLMLGDNSIVEADIAAFEQSSLGVLHIDLAGTATGDFDRLLVAGAAQLDGTLDVSLIGGFNPLLGDEFTILSAALGVSGRFATVNSPVLDAGLALNVVYNSQSVVVKIGVAGDFDGDLDVDGADFVAWQTHFPTAMGATLADGDADGDGDVDGADFVIWQTNFPFTPAPTATPVPEPAAWLLAICSLAGLTRRFRHVSVVATAG